MNKLSAGASTQSRARRPLPARWQPCVVARKGAAETWEFPDGSRITGEQEPKDLAEKTGCPLP